ncbi:S1C family serine protease [Alteribacillus sp. HJP-4]|uniref:S1C family serine protease n=1 Tax=Alteribacillus sp. HJP-4 TaxID=2775394 RepID=UPI0035CCD3E5
MGYYNNYGGSKREEAVQDKKKKSGYFLSSFAGFLAGAVVVFMFSSQLPFTDAAEDRSPDQEASANTETVSYDVNSDVTDAVEKSRDAVVGVANIQENNSQNGMFPGQSQDTEEGEGQEAGAGSGVVYKKEGDSAFVVTNNHVIDGADQIEVTLSDGTKKEAELVGADVWTDLAVLKMDSEAVGNVAEFGDSSALTAGEAVIAIGNPLGEQFSGSVTTGVISGTERSVPVDVNQDGVDDWESEVIQTDAAINPGNSGGALINSQGQVIGINSMKITESAVEGIGLAIPANSALPIIEDLENVGEVARPSIGVQLLDLTSIPQQYQQPLNLPEDVTTGAVIQGVQPNSAASESGLQEMDVITELDGEVIETTAQLRQYLYTHKEADEEMDVTLYRDGEKQKITLSLGESEDNA